MANKDYTKAGDLAARAVALQPKEALFHGMQGFVALQKSQPAEALADYQRALALDGDYYQHYVGAGLAAKGSSAMLRRRNTSRRA